MSRILFPLMFLAALLSGCNGATGPACADNAQCNNQACIEGVCRDVDCLASSECQLYEYCHPEEYTCTPGCSEDTDCLAGESCDMSSNTCEGYGCRDTQLDCEIGEFCNASSGDCYDDPYGTCDTCSYSENSDDILDLIIYGEVNGDRHCVQWDAAGSTFYWLALCNVNQGTDACARGFTCVPDIYGDATMRVDACIGDCDYYRQNGYL